MKKLEKLNLGDFRTKELNGRESNYYQGGLAQYGLTIVCISTYVPGNKIPMFDMVAQQDNDDI